MNMVKDRTDIEAFSDVMRSCDDWERIDDIVRRCDEAEFWTAGFIATATVAAKKAHIRKLIKSQKDETNWPLWASIEVTDATGNISRIYKQECLFDVSDYRQVAAFHADRSHHHRAMAVGYAKRCRKRFNTQLTLQF